MGEISIKIHNKAFRVSCDDGEEARLEALAEHVRSKFDELSQQFGRVGDERLLLMTALLIADELWQVREERDREGPKKKPGAAA